MIYLLFHAILLGVCLYDYWRREPGGPWLWVMLFFGPLGCGVYLAMVVAPGYLSSGATSLQNTLNPKDRQEWRLLRARVRDDSPQREVERLMMLSAKYGKPDDTVAYAERVLARDPGNLTAVYSLGLAHWRQQQLSEAERYLRQVVEREPRYDYGMAYLALAEILRDQGNTVESLAAYETSLKQSSYPMAQYHYAALLKDSGRSEDARRVLTELVHSEHHLPKFRRKKELPWIRKGQKLLRTL